MIQGQVGVIALPFLVHSASYPQQDYHCQLAERPFSTRISTDRRPWRYPEYALFSFWIYTGSEFTLIALEFKLHHDRLLVSRFIPSPTEGQLPSEEEQPDHAV